jgi:DNA repair exonuclease SbcCD nuclease subunit
MLYAVVSDLHCHAWSTYATVHADGVNSRLRIILNELWRAASELHDAGGKTLVVAGDIFHVRGSVDPEVLNPVQETFRSIMDNFGVSILMIPGNHDLKGKETSALGSAIQTLAETFSAEGSIRVLNEPTTVKFDDGNFLAFVPWRSKVDDLLKDLEDLARRGNKHLTDVFIHAGIDGVLSGVPAHGLPASRLASIGFRRVFAGHYHNHCDMGDGVFSIGATTHQNWGDIGTAAGFLLVDENEVRFHPSKSPNFVDISGMKEEEMEINAYGNYVRFRGDPMKDEDVRELREFLLKAGAQGVSIQAAKQVVSVRTATVGRTGLTLDQSVGGFVDTTKDFAAHIDRIVVKQECADILSAVRAVENA